MPYLPLKMLSPLFLIQNYNPVGGILNFWDGRFTVKCCRILHGSPLVQRIPKENFCTLHVFPSDKKPVLCLCLLFCLSIHLSVRPSVCLSVIRFIWVPFIQIGVCTMYLLTLTEASPADHLLFSLTCVYNMYPVHAYWGYQSLCAVRKRSLFHS